MLNLVPLQTTKKIVAVTIIAATFLLGSLAHLTSAVIAATLPGHLDVQISHVTIGKDGSIAVHFNVADYPANVIAIEATLAKFINDDKGWISMMQRDRTYSEWATNVIRASNLRETINISNGAATFTFAHKGEKINFLQGAYWTHDKPKAEGAYGEYIKGILDEVEKYGKWDQNAVYRVGITSRQDERFTAIYYFRGDGTRVLTANAPRQEINVASCTTCHSNMNFEAHSNRRHDPQLCTSCHNNFTYDSLNSSAKPNGWTKIDMMTITHMIHSGIQGYKVADVDYSDNPAIINFCIACHQGGVPLPPRRY